MKIIIGLIALIMLFITIIIFQTNDLNANGTSDSKISYQREVPPSEDQALILKEKESMVQVWDDREPAPNPYSN